MLLLVGSWFYSLSCEQSYQALGNIGQQMFHQRINVLFLAREILKLKYTNSMKTPFYGKVVSPNWGWGFYIFAPNRIEIMHGLNVNFFYFLLINIWSRAQSLTTFLLCDVNSILVSLHETNEDIVQSRGVNGFAWILDRMVFIVVICMVFLIRDTWPSRFMRP